MTITLSSGIGMLIVMGLQTVFAKIRPVGNAVDQSLRLSLLQPLKAA